jgi:hypothetical protein
MSNVYKFWEPQSPEALRASPGPYKDCFLHGFFAVKNLEENIIPSKSSKKGY